MSTYLYGPVNVVNEIWPFVSVIQLHVSKDRRMGSVGPFVLSLHFSSAFHGCSINIKQVEKN
jgi:hypothetical protein